MNASFYANQLIDILESGLYDKNNSYFIGRLKILGKLIKKM
jgi:hypothetical protein